MGRSDIGRLYALLVLSAVAAMALLLVGGPQPAGADPPPSCPSCTPDPNYPANGSPCPYLGAPDSVCPRKLSISSGGAPMPTSQYPDSSACRSATQPSPACPNVVPAAPVQYPYDWLGPGLPPLVPGGPNSVEVLSDQSPCPDVNSPTCVKDTTAPAAPIYNSPSAPGF